MVGWAARVDALVTPERVRNYSLIIMTLAAAAMLLNALLGRGIITASGEVVLPDHLAHWTGGRLLLEGHARALYDPAVQSAQQRAAGPVTGLSWFVSPPVAALLFAPFAVLPYGWSAAVWTVVSVSLLLASVLLVRPLLPGRRQDAALLTLAFVASPPVFQVLGAGQDTTVALVVLVVALRLLLAGRTAGAGAVLALGLVKPHLFVLVPIALLAQRRYRTLLVGALTSAGLVLATLPVLGWQAWRAWAAALASPLYTQQVQGGQTWQMQSVSGFATAVGAPPVVAYPVLLVGAAALLLRLRRCRDDTVAVWALTLAATLVFSPHAMVYDLVLLLPALALRPPPGRERAVRLLTVFALVVLWSLPVRQTVAEAAPGWSVLALPWSALALLALWLLVSGGPRGAVPPAPGPPSGVEEERGAATRRPG